MSATNFNTSNQTFRQLMGNGLSYHVPRFQRDYSWSQDEWEDLWQDIQDTQPPDGEPAHYMGYLVLQTNDGKNFDVIDGQQRLTTLSLLVLAVLRALQALANDGIQADENRRRTDQLRNSYIGFLDPVSLTSRSKLTLNRNNDAYYKDYLSPLAKLPKYKLRLSEKLLRGAFEWFSKQVTDKLTLDGAALARFLDELSDKLFFTVITVTDELNAFRVFETLNARGVRLSPTDLLKNYLFSIVFREYAHEQEIDTLERRWDAMIGRLGDEKFPNFLRLHWNSRNSFVREADLFKTIRANTPNRERVFELLREMEEDVEVYAALTDAESSYWSAKQKVFARELRLFGIRQPWPALLAAARILNEKEFEAILRACSIVSFRYNVIGGLATGEQERVYNAIAQRIARKELQSAPDIIRSLEPLYISDDAFRTAFTEKSLKTTDNRNKKVARYILFAIESHASPNHGAYDIENAQYTIEHILSENRSDSWGEFGEASAEEAVYRLGNLTILEQKLNRIAGNHAFNTKKTAYAKSSLEITRSIAEKNKTWTMERLAARQRWMAEQATAIWRIDQLS
jgi:uncharacterized protein with ParB-like and HNH nuclease domain